MLRRYAPRLTWNVVLATEIPESQLCKEISETFGVRLLELPMTATGFLESRLWALKALQGTYKYCLPLQDDFILEGACDGEALAEAFNLMEVDPACASVRLMPCPGPKMISADWARWARLDPAADQYGFVFQATLWKTEACLKWYERITDILELAAPKATTDPKVRRDIEIAQNIAENGTGQKEFWKWSAERGEYHLAWVRRGSWPNAVYLSPFPYRPTAIVRGSVEPWVHELLRREGIKI
jgi:hypothetical protein